MTITDHTTDLIDITVDIYIYISGYGHYITCGVRERWLSNMYIYIYIICMYSDMVVTSSLLLSSRYGGKLRGHHGDIPSLRPFEKWKIQHFR